MANKLMKDEIIDAFRDGLVVCHLKGDAESFNSNGLCDFMIENMDSLLENQIDISEEPDFEEVR